MWSEILIVRGMMIDSYFTILHTLIYSYILQKQPPEVYCKKGLLKNFEDLSTLFLATIFNQIRPKSSCSMYSSFLMLENIWYHQFTWSGSNSQEIANLIQFNSRPRGPIIGTKLTISCEFGPLQVKWRCHMFSNMK